MRRLGKDQTEDDREQIETERSERRHGAARGLWCWASELHSIERHRLVLVWYDWLAASQMGKCERNRCEEDVSRRFENSHSHSLYVTAAKNLFPTCSSKHTLLRASFLFLRRTVSGYQTSRQVLTRNILYIITYKHNSINTLHIIHRRPSNALRCATQE